MGFIVVEAAPTADAPCPARQTLWKIIHYAAVIIIDAFDFVIGDVSNLCIFLSCKPVAGILLLFNHRLTGVNNPELISWNFFNILIKTLKQIVPFALVSVSVGSKELCLQCHSAPIVT